MKQLKDADFSPNEYLRQAKAQARKAGLDDSSLTFASDGIHKLEIKNEKGNIRRFGRVGYGDYLIWSHLEKLKRTPVGKSAESRKRFRESHQRIRGAWRSDKYSPNNLALSVLW
jgi:hypothetical protein